MEQSAEFVPPDESKESEIMGTRDRGLYGKYRVERVDGKPLKGGFCIVLEIGDPNSHAALLTWADTVEADGYAPLAAEVRALVWEHADG